MAPLSIFSFGGGVQSMAVLVLAAHGQLRYDAFLFSNVGEDSESPDTLVYYREFAEPFAQQHDVQLVELHGSRTLLHHIELSERWLPIPVRMSNGAPGRRACTVDYKIRRIARWTKQQGATPGQPAVVGVGISTDEWHRVSSRHDIPWETVEYPLIDRRLSRADCAALIRAEGLPVPPKSSCWFCPFHTPSHWRWLQASRSDLFDRCVALEAMLNERRGRIGKDHVYLTRFGKPLIEAFAGRQGLLFDGLDLDNCESGYCMT